jgi:hypothetical protein
MSTPLSANAGYAPRLEQTRTTPGVKIANSPEHNRGPASEARLHGAAETSAALLDSGAATLDQYDQHNNSQHSAHDLDDSSTVHVHINSSFPQ